MACSGWNLALLLLAGLGGSYFLCGLQTFTCISLGVFEVPQYWAALPHSLSDGFHVEDSSGQVGNDVASTFHIGTEYKPIESLFLFLFLFIYFLINLFLIYIFLTFTDCYLALH